MSRRPPDICKHVFICAFGDWQVQVGPRARSDIGGAVDTFYEVGEAHRVHIFAEHTESERESMRRQLQGMNAPEDMTRRGPDGRTAAYLMAVPLPRWWVEK